jgi:transcriptional regulator with XRE-family HTH domain
MGIRPIFSGRVEQIEHVLFCKRLSTALGFDVCTHDKETPMSEKNELSAAIGLRLRAERHQRKLSLSQLAALTGDILAKSRISNYEQGIRRMGIEESVMLARALGDVSPVYLLCLDDSDPLASDELHLLALYRASDKRGRAMIASVAESEADRSHGDQAQAA